MRAPVLLGRKKSDPAGLYIFRATRPEGEGDEDHTGKKREGEERLWSEGSLLRQKTAVTLKRDTVEEF